MPATRSSRGDAPAASRVRGPVPTIQALLWCYLLLFAAILAWIATPPSYWEL